MDNAYDILVKNVTPEEISKYVKGMKVELAGHKFDGKFRKHLEKGIEILNPTQQEKAEKKLLDMAEKLDKQFFNLDKKAKQFENVLKKADLADLRKEMRKLGKNSGKMNDALKNLAKQMPQLMKEMGAVKNLEWVNIGLTAVDIAATVASTVIICQKLDEMSCRLDTIAGKVDSLRGVANQFFIRKPMRELLSEYKDISGDLEKGRPVSPERMKKAIRECRSLIQSVLDIPDMEADDLLEVLYALLPVFTSLIMLYYQAAYDDLGGLDNLHSEWMAVYDALDSENFREALREYYMIDQHMHNQQVNEILDCQRLLGINQRLQIEDLLEDIRQCGGSQAYKQMEDFTEALVREQAEPMKQSLSDIFTPDVAERVVAAAFAG